MIFIDESNFYKAVFQSRKPEAEAFTEWVTGEVLPSIRKHGAYMTANIIEKALTDPDTIIQLATTLKEERAEKERFMLQAQQQQKELQESAPKVQFYNDVLQSKDLFNVTQVAADLGVSAVMFNRWMFTKGFQFRTNGIWVPSAKIKPLDYMRSKTHTYHDSNGNPHVTQLYYLTQAGREFMVHTWRKERSHQKELEVPHSKLNP